MNRSVLIVFLLAFGVIPGRGLFAQNNIVHQPPTVIERNETVLLEFRFLGIQDNQVSNAVFFTRPTSGTSFSQQEVRVTNGLARIPLQITSPDATDAEYYIRVQLTNGSEIVYPDVDAGDPPFIVNIVEPDEEEEYQPAEFIDSTILSPKPGKAVSDIDLLVAVALFYDDEDVEGGEFRLLVNGQDVTEEAEISPFTIKFKPGAVPDGTQNIQVLFIKDDVTYEVTNWEFRAVTGQPVAFGRYEQPQRRLPGGRIELGARNQEIAGSENDVITGRVRVSGKEGAMEYTLSGYLTSRDQARLQPQNRYSADIRYGRWLELQAGDVYPNVSAMTISGRRVRGVHTKISAFRDAIEAQFLLGKMNRQISNLYDSILVEEDGFGTSYVIGFEDGGRGVYQQDIIGGRVAFGRESSFRIGFHAMKIEDDTTSIDVIRNFNDVMNVNPALISGLQDSDRQYLAENPGELQIAGSNPRPRGNFVAGSDLTFLLHNRQIRFKSEAGVSMLNQDISEGILTRERADELGFDLDQDIENLFDRLSWLIIINENMSTVPFRLSEQENGDFEVDPFFPTAVLASDSRLNLNYFNNQLEVRYRWIGPDYQSLANSTVRRDIAGITLSDRFRVFQNRIYVTMGYENLNDNILDERPATTNTTTYSGSVSWFPVKRILPRVNVSARFRVRDNGIDRFNPSVANDFLDVAVRNFQTINGDVVTTITPRLRETLVLSSSVTQSFTLFDLSHEAVVSAGISQTDDKRFRYGNSESTNFSVRLMSRLDDMGLPFRTRIGFNTNRSESVNGLSFVQIQGVDVGAESILMQGNLTLSTDLAFTRNEFNTLPLTTTAEGGDAAIYIPADEQERNRRQTNAFIIRANAQYNFLTSHAIAATANITNLRVSLGETGSVPNDRVLQLRYIFNF